MHGPPLECQSPPYHKWEPSGNTQKAPRSLSVPAAFLFFVFLKYLRIPVRSLRRSLRVPDAPTPDLALFISSTSTQGTATMKTPVLAILSAAAAVRATGDDDKHGLYKGPIGFPPGVEAPPAKFLPHKPPPFEKPLPIWHPPHEGVFIDDCDEEYEEDWHWAWNKHGDKPHPGPPHKWTTTTVTVTKTEGDAGPTEEVTETVCPVPVTDEPAPTAKPTGDHEKPAPPGAEPAPEPTAPPADDEDEAPPAAEPPVEDESPEEPEGPPADAPEEEEPNVSGEPEREPPVEAGGAGKNAVGILAVVAGVVAALF